jgi:hypothetical protein
VSRPSGDTVVALVVSLLLVAAMAIDHLVGTSTEPGEESGLADPGAFVFGIAVSLIVLAVLFVFVVRRTPDPDHAGRRGLLCSGLAVPAVVLAFLGLPYSFAAAGIALGLRGRSGRRARLATAAILLGSLVVVAVTAGYVVALIA